MWTKRERQKEGETVFSHNWLTYFCVLKYTLNTLIVLLQGASRIIIKNKIQEKVSMFYFLHNKNVRVFGKVVEETCI